MSSTLDPDKRVHADSSIAYKYGGLHQKSWTCQDRVRYRAEFLGKYQC